MSKFFKPTTVQALCNTIDWEAGEQRVDAISAPLLVSEALHDVQSQAVRYLYPDLMARQVLPLNTNVDEGASHTVWFEYDVVTMAKVVENYATDLPVVGAEASEQSSPLKVVATSYVYSTEDLRRVAFARSNGRMAQLDADKAMIADEAIERKFDDLAIKGDSVTGLPGLCRNANVTTISAAAAAAGANAPEWDGADKTPQEIFDDLINLVTTMRDTSKGVHRVDFIGVPTAQYTVISQTLMLENTGQPYTILEAFQRQNPGVTVMEWPALETAGASDVELVVALDTRPLNMEMVIPMEARPLPPQPKGLNFVVPVEAKFGGVIIKRPLAALYMDDV